MNKAWALIVAALAAGLPVAGAGAPLMETGPGCGLGAMLWADSPAKKRILQQAMIATTNQTGLQTLALSSGTSGCTNDGVIARREKVNVFAGANFRDLMQDMARGSGEHLSSLADLLGVPEAVRPRLFLLVQEEYRAIAVPEATPSTVLHALARVMSGDPALAPFAASL
ncbi:DUF3015 family protein [Candidatus Nitrospira bockiana]